MPVPDVMNAAALAAQVSVALARSAALGRGASFGAAAAVLGTGTGAGGAVIWVLSSEREPGPGYRWVAPGAGTAEPAAVDLPTLAGPGWYDRLAAGEIIETELAEPAAAPWPRPVQFVGLRFDGELVGALALLGASGTGPIGTGPDGTDPLPVRSAPVTAALDVLAAGVVTDRLLERANAVAADARSMLDDIGAVIVRIGADGRINFVNKAWTSLTGISFEDIIGKDAMHHVHPDDRVLAAQHLGAVISGSTEAREVRFLSWDGSARWMEVKGRALFADGALAGLAGILHDVTERRGAELEAHDARTRAEHAQAIAERASQAKSDFLSRMSHELRTPLNAIVGFSELLGSGDLPAEDLESVAQISAAGRHLLDLVTEALDVTRIENGQLPVRLGAVPVARLAAECVALMRPAAADNGLRLQEVPVGHAGLRALADPQRLRQVLLNLLSNAVKYSRPGGQVSVDCYPLNLETPLGRDAPYGWLRIAVVDTGIGIPTDRLDDVFLPFERIGAERTDIEGTGLGLALTRGLVEAMQGQITVHSVPGVGTTFQVDLPAAPDETAPDETAPGAGDATGAGDAPGDASAAGRVRPEGQR